MKAMDCDGREIEVGLSVDVPASDDNCEFTGEVFAIFIDNDGTVCVTVKDQEDNYFDVDADEVRVTEDCQGEYDEADKED